MGILGKLRETALSVMPVMAVVAALGLLTGTLDTGTLLRFAWGGLCLVAGLAVFLLGVDVGIRPLGEMCGAALTARRNLALFVAAAFAVGFVVTVAEPDIQVFVRQVAAADPHVRHGPLVLSIGLGVGLFMAAGVARAVAGLRLKAVLAVSYALLPILALAAPRPMIAIAFDSGGATTGPMTVPFIMALGLGVSAVRDDGEGGFGLTGIASVGPVMAVLAYSLIAGGGGQASALQSEAAGHSFREAFRDAFLSVVPLIALLCLFRAVFLRMSARQTIRISIGFAYAFVGLGLFLYGINSGFMECGRVLGEALGGHARAGGWQWWTVLMAAGVAFGSGTVCAEPAVWTLCEQVEEATRGAVRRRALLVFLAAGTSLAICLALFRALAGFPIGWILVPGYAAAFILMAFSPPFFSGMAFDSGGVASGPLTSTFILSFVLGAAGASGGAADSFGVIALVAMMPLVAIQAMGIAYSLRRRRTAAQRLEGPESPEGHESPEGRESPGGHSS